MQDIFKITFLKKLHLLVDGLVSSAKYTLMGLVKVALKKFNKGLVDFNC
jgi:hypothetical protein